MDVNEKNKNVRELYGAVARGATGCGCGFFAGGREKEYAKSLGYSDSELGAIPAEANLALSCGNPTALAGLKEGETVLDLGSGAGFDCFLAADKVGPAGRVIGVDMTPEMIEKARSIAAKDNFMNVEFRLGEIENLPVADDTVDVVLSNCVINLSVDKERVFREIYRVLKPGGRVVISDIALIQELPEKVQNSVAAYVGCVAGAYLLDEYKQLVEASGLRDAKITVKDSSALIGQAAEDPLGKAILAEFEGRSMEDYIAGIYVEGVK